MWQIFFPGSVFIIYVRHFFFRLPLSYMNKVNITRRKRRNVSFSQLTSALRFCSKKIAILLERKNQAAIISRFLCSNKDILRRVCFILATNENKDCKSRPLDDDVPREHFHFNGCDENCYLSC